MGLHAQSLLLWVQISLCVTFHRQVICCKKLPKSQQGLYVWMVPSHPWCMYIETPTKLTHTTFLGTKFSLLLNVPQNICTFSVPHKWKLEAPHTFPAPFVLCILPHGTALSFPCKTMHVYLFLVCSNIAKSCCSHSHCLSMCLCEQRFI